MTSTPLRHGGEVYRECRPRRRQASRGIRRSICARRGPCTQSRGRSGRSPRHGSSGHHSHARSRDTCRTSDTFDHGRTHRSRRAPVTTRARDASTSIESRRGASGVGAGPASSLTQDRRVHAPHRNDRAERNVRAWSAREFREFTEHRRMASNRVLIAREFEFFVRRVNAVIVEAKANEQ